MIPGIKNHKQGNTLYKDKPPCPPKDGSITQYSEPFYSLKDNPY
jgi:hypothetical protein